jgi:hypothetical protein
MEDPTKNPRYIHHPLDPDRWRYYIVERDILRATGDYALLNKDELVKNGRWLGHLDIRVDAGTYPNGYPAYYGGWFGLPDLCVKPQIKVGIRAKLLDVYGQGHNLWYVSTRTKFLLESIDAEAFEFFECETTSRRGAVVEPYWMMAVKRVVMEFDEDRSDIVERGGRSPLPEGMSIGISNINDFYPAADMSKDWHAFYLLKYDDLFIFDQAIVDCWRAEKFTGWMFSPLQPPTKKEARKSLLFKNPSYYFRFD